MKLPLYIKPIKNVNDIFNPNDPLLKYLIDDYTDGDDKILIYEFPENFYFNLKYFDEQVENKIYKEFKIDLKSNGGKIVKVVL